MHFTTTGGKQRSSEKRVLLVGSSGESRSSITPAEQMNVRHLPQAPVSGVLELRRCLTHGRNNSGARRPDWLPADVLTSALAPGRCLHCGAKLPRDDKNTSAV